MNTLIVNSVKLNKIYFLKKKILLCIFYFLIFNVKEKIFSQFSKKIIFIETILIIFMIFFLFLVDINKNLK